MCTAQWSQSTLQDLPCHASVLGVTPDPGSDLGLQVPRLLRLSRRWLRWPSLRRCRSAAASPLRAGQGESSPLAHMAAQAAGIRGKHLTPWPVAENLTTTFPLWIIVGEDRQDFPASKLVWFSSFPLPLSPCPKRRHLTQLCDDDALLCDL